MALLRRILVLILFVNPAWSGSELIQLGARGFISWYNFEHHVNESERYTIVSETNKNVQANLEMMTVGQGRRIAWFTIRYLEMCAVACSAAPDCHFIRIVDGDRDPERSGAMCGLYSELGNTTEIRSNRCSETSYVQQIKEKIILKKREMEKLRVQN